MKHGLPAKLAIVLLMASPFVFSQQNDPFCSVWEGETLYTGYTTLSRACSSLPGTETKCYIERSTLTQCAQSNSQPSASYCYPMIVTSEACSSVQINATVNQPQDSDNPIYTELNTIGEIRVDGVPLMSAGDVNHMVYTTFAELHKANIQLNDGLKRLSQNDNVINTNVVTLSSRMAQFISNVSSAKSSADAAKASSDLTRDAVNATNQSISNLKSELLQSNDALSQSLSEVKSISEDMQLTATVDALRNEQLHQQTQAAQATAQISLDSIEQDTDNSAHNTALASDYASQANYNAQQAYNMASEAAYNSGYLMGDVSDTKNMTNEILNLMLEGETGEPGEPGEGPDMAETNEILTSIKSDANTNTQRIIDTISPLESQLSEVNGNLGWLSEHVGQQLQGIQTAIENGSGTGGGSDDDTVTNQKLDGLGDKLDGIKSSIDGLTDTTGLSQQLSDINNNTNADLSADMDSFYSEFNTEEKMTQLQTTVSGMVNDSGLSDYDSVDKVRNSLAEATTISQVFDVSRASCSPYQFWQKEINFCPAAQKTSMVLEYFIWAITAIFAFLHITAFLTKLRTE